MESGTKWRRFEDLTANVQRILAPDATVEQNVRIRGRDSGSLREIDIAVRTRVGPHHIFIALECKDYASAVDVEKVEAFATKIQDVRADKGAMVSSKGFTSGAKGVAERHGISLHRVVDTGDHPWRSRLTVPTILRAPGIASYSLRFSSVDYHPFFIRTDQPVTEMAIHDGNGSARGTIRDLILAGWNEGRYTQRTGRHEGIPLVDGAAFTELDGNRYPINIALSLEVFEELRFGWLEVAKFSGLSDELGGEIAGGPVHLAPIPTEEITSSWAKLDSIDDAPSKPILEIDAQYIYESGPNGGSRSFGDD